MSGANALSEFSALPDQEHPVRLLQTILSKGTIPHAILFTGIEGTGKGDAAIIFAMALNCRAPMGPDAATPQGEAEGPVRTDPCGHCPSCGKFRSGNHPDLIRIQPTGGIIRIAQVRELVDRLSVRPNEARYRLVLIAEAHAMNKEAANALLKALEEPPARTLFILTATQTTALLPTIVSRCQHIRFNPVSQSSIEALLAAEGIAPEVAQGAAAMAGGSLATAFELAGERWQRRRLWLLDAFDGLTGGGAAPLLALAEKLAQEKELLARSLEILKGYLRDLMIHRADPSAVINRDQLARIRQNELKYALPSLIKKTDALAKAQRDLAANGNPRLILEVLMLELARS